MKGEPLEPLVRSRCIIQPKKGGGFCFERAKDCEVGGCIISTNTSYGGRSEMKKVLLLLLSVSILFAIGCGSGGGGSSTASSSPTTPGNPEVTPAGYGRIVIDVSKLKESQGEKEAEALSFNNLRIVVRLLTQGTGCTDENGDPIPCPLTETYKQVADFLNFSSPVTVVVPVTPSGAPGYDIYALTFDNSIAYGTTKLKAVGKYGQTTNPVIVTPSAIPNVSIATSTISTLFPFAVPGNTMDSGTTYNLTPSGLTFPLRVGVGYVKDAVGTTPPAEAPYDIAGSGAQPINKYIPPAYACSTTPCSAQSLSLQRELFFDNALLAAGEDFHTLVAFTSLTVTENPAISIPITITSPK